MLLPSSVTVGSYSASLENSCAKSAFCCCSKIPELISLKRRKELKVTLRRQGQRNLCRASSSPDQPKATGRPCLLKKKRRCGVGERKVEAGMVTQRKDTLYSYIIFFLLPHNSFQSPPTYLPTHPIRSLSLCASVSLLSGQAP